MVCVFREKIPNTPQPFKYDFLDMFDFVVYLRVCTWTTTLCCLYNYQAEKCTLSSNNYKCVFRMKKVTKNKIIFGIAWAGTSPEEKYIY